MKIPKPTGQRVLVEPVRAERYIGNLHLPDRAVERNPAEAVVVAVGACCKVDVKVGDRVVTARYEGDEVRVGEVHYRLLRPEDLLAIVTE